MNLQNNQKSTSKSKYFIAIAILLLAGGTYFFFVKEKNTVPAESDTPASIKTTSPSESEDQLSITAVKAKEVKPGPVQIKTFEQKHDAIGIIDFNQDKLVPVFSAYAGKISKVLVKAGDEVNAGQVLFTIQVPDIASAASNLLSSAGSLKVANATLKRAKELAEFKSISLKELEQNIADQQSAEGNYEAALKTMRLFDLNEDDIQQILNGRKVDVEMAVKSPVKGKVVNRNAAPGAFVQPGNAPAPITISDTDRLWLVANIPESEISFYKLGQRISVSVQAYPNTFFEANISYIADSVDPNSHRVTIRAEIANTKHQLLPQMLASFTIYSGDPIHSPALPLTAVVRENDGNFSAWITNNGKDFTRRVVKTGLSQDGYIQILDGLKQGEIAAQDKALFLSNLFITTH
jgi:cobalt-zinc-cadmium efflux system membrane fusion protein